MKSVFSDTPRIFGILKTHVLRFPRTWPTNLSMKKSVLIALAVLTSFTALSAFAHIEPGIWKGVNPDGKECVLEVFEQTFESDVRHPLNERIRVRVNGDEFQIYHPRAIDATKGLVSFNHDFFEGVLATSVGSNAIVITMVHSDEFEGPSSFRWMRDNWKTGDGAMLTCEKLKHIAGFRR